MTWFEKLRHEWKTFAWGAAGLLLESYDSILAPFLQSNPLVPDKYKWVDAIVIPVGFMLLRKWRDSHPESD